jgi:alcohol dehydrogenase class IV
MKFEFATAGRVIFGRGVTNQIAPMAVELGRSPLVVTGRDSERIAPLIEQMKAEGLETSVFSVEGEPTTETALKGAEQAEQGKCDLVISIGGGSAMDAGKAVAALLTNSGGLLNYLEVIGKGRALRRPPAPHIAVPTTAGTGAEVTRNAVLRSLEHNVKVSMRSPMMLSTVAIVDPLLTLSVPPDVTASTGLDALTQLMEAFVCNKSNPITDGICVEGMKRAARSLERAYLNGSDEDAREDMSIASLFGGLALANAALGAVHGFAGPIGGMFEAPHGAVCAGLLAHVMETNIKALKNRAPGSWALKRYDELAQIVTGDAQAQADDGVAWVKKLNETLNVSALTRFGIGREHIEQIVEKSKSASSMKGNPIELTEGELAGILSKALWEK